MKNLEQLTHYRILDFESELLFISSGNSFQSRLMDFENVRLWNILSGSKDGTEENRKLKCAVQPIKHEKEKDMPYCQKIGYIQEKGF